MSIMPKELNYASPPPLPANLSTQEIVIQPSNGSTFGGASTTMMEFQLANTDAILPDTIYLRYNLNVINTTGTAVTVAGTDGIRGCPAVAPLLKSELYAGSQLLEVQNDYNVMLNDLVNLTYSTSDKYGQQSSLGYTMATSGSVATGGEQSLDCFTGVVGIGSTVTLSVAVPLVNMISNCEKVFPAFLAQNLILRLTTDTNTNIINNTTANTALTYSITNAELCYTSLKLSEDIKQMIVSQAGADGKFFVKSSSWNNSVQTISTGTSGAIALAFQHRYASIRSVFSHFVNTASTVDGKFASAQPCTSSYTAQYEVGNSLYPQRQLDSGYNAGAFIMELRKAMGGLTAKSNSMSINTLEFGRKSGSTGTLNEPGKHIFGVNTQVLNSDNLLTGISSASSPINLRLNINGAVGASYSVYCYVNFDALLEFDVINRSVVART